MVLSVVGLLLAGLNIPFQRVPAVDGTSLPKARTDAPDHEYVLSRAEIACAQSHLKCWDLFERSGEDHCVILEDDVHFGDDFAAG